MKKNRFVKLFTLLVIAMIFILMFVGCSSNKSVSTKVADDFNELKIENFEKQKGDNLSEIDYFKYSKNITIGFAMDSLKEERWRNDGKFFVEKATEMGAKVRITEADGDERLQISQAEQLIAEGVNVLVVVPVNGDTASEIVDKAHKAGIKVLSYDRLVRNSDLDYYVSFDNVIAGEIQAKAMLRAVSNGELAYVGGSPKDNNAILFRDGAIDGLKDKISSKEISLIMDKYSDEWKPDEAYKNVKEMLTTNKDKIKGIICANDGTAYGAIEALKEVGLDGKIPVTGQDADLKACQRIVEGKQLMTVYKPVKQIAEKAAEVAINIAENKSISTNSTIDNGYKKVPSYLLEPIEVNKDNIKDTVIKDGWQKSEEVYKNTK